MASKHDVQEEKCALCTEDFKVPKILPCLHSFCEQCITDHMTNKKVNDRDVLYCPVCRAVVKPAGLELKLSEWVQRLPRDLVIDILLSQKNGINQECQVCSRLNQTAIATVLCTACEECMCDNCHENHDGMKLLMNHRVVPLTEIKNERNRLLSNAIVDNCDCHSTKRVEHFCKGHNVVFCCGCLHSKHENCEAVKSIDKILNNDNKYQNISDNLAGLRDIVINILETTNQQKAKLSSKIEHAEREASTIVEALKSKLDNDFQTFAKELKVFHEEENTKINVRMRLLEQLAKTIEHWIESSEAFDRATHGTKLFIIVQTIREQVQRGVKEMIRNLNEKDVINVKLNVNKALKELETSVTLLSFEASKESLPFELKSVRTFCKNIGASSFPSFEDLELIHCDSIKGSYLKCGVCLDEQYMVVGITDTTTHLNLIDLTTKAEIHTLTFGGDIKRLCYDSKSKQMFVSCYSKELYVVKIQNNSMIHPQKLTFNKDYVGGISSLNDNIYVVVDGYIKKFPTNAGTDKQGAMTTCFQTNTECGLNGLAFKNNRLIYTTGYDEIKCASLDGKIEFCYKSPSIASPKGLVVLPSDLFLVMDQQDNGKLHLLSADGKQHRTLLENFSSVKNPTDIWLNIDKDMVFVCGDENIDVYDIDVKA